MSPTRLLHCASCAAALLLVGTPTVPAVFLLLVVRSLHSSSLSEEAVGSLRTSPLFLTKATWFENELGVQAPVGFWDPAGNLICLTGLLVCCKLAKLKAYGPKL